MRKKIICKCDRIYITNPFSVSRIWVQQGDLFIILSCFEFYLKRLLFYQRTYCERERLCKHRVEKKNHPRDNTRKCFVFFFSSVDFN